jgi:non-ribosomal peptide synthetase component F
MNYEVSPVEFDPFAGPEIALVAPATEPQIEIWTSCLIGGADASCAYNDAASLLLTGPFDKDAMFKALQALSDRHEALRTVFSADGQSFLVYDNPPLHIDYHDLSLQSETQNDLFIENYTRQNAITALDLVNGPLFKPTILKLSSQEHYITFIAHHIICDGWSIGVMMQELSKLYSAFAKGEWPNLPPAPKYSDYAVEQNALIDTPERHEIEDYWVNQFKGSTHLLNVPTDNPRPAQRTYKSKRADFALDAKLVADVRQMARKAGASFVTTLMAAFEVYLQQITGHEEIILGLPAAGQSAAGNYGLVGHCVNLLALRSHPKGEQSFVDYLKERKTQVLDAYDHQMFTFGSLLKKLNIPRDPSRAPLVPVVFNIDIGMDEGVDFYNLRRRYITTGREYENFEIFLNITDHKDALVLEWSYNTQIFEPASISLMMDEYQHLLKQLVNSPDKLIGKLPLMRADEFTAQLKAWNETRVEYPKEKSLHQIISETAAKNPGSVALKFGNEQFTYKQLNEKANQLAWALVAEGVKKGDKIAISVDRSADLIVGLLAIIKAGGVYVPLDPIFPINRINYMLTDSGAAVLLTAADYAGKYESKAKELLLADMIANMGNQPVTEPDVTVSGKDLLYILYTSGSTGQPKGVQIAHHNMVNFLYSMQKEPGLTAQDKLLAVTTISFDIAGLELFLPLLTGAQIVLVDAATAKDGYALLDIIREEKITAMQATPYTWRIMLEAGWETEAIKAICGGEALPMDLATKYIVAGHPPCGMFMGQPKPPSGLP